MEATRKLMKSFSINKHDRGRMFYLQVIVRSTKEREGDKGAARERRGRRGGGSLKNDFLLKTALLAKE